MSRTSLVLVVALAATCSRARADEPPAPVPLPALSYENTFLVRSNPLGLGDELDLRYRHALYASEHPALAQNFVGVVAPWLLAPSLFRPGIGVELQPLSLLHLYVGYEPTLYFGAVGSLHAFSTSDADYGSTAFQLGGPHAPPGAIYATVVHQVAFAATVQFARRWFAFRSMWRGQWVHADLRDSDNSFYDPLYVVLMPRTGWLMHMETDALYRSRVGLSAGLHYVLTMTTLSPPIQLLGGTVAYTFATHDARGRFAAPTLALLVAWYLEDRYRTGQLVSQAIPMIGLAFQFRGSLLETRR